jgi:hypothetical protein
MSDFRAEDSCKNGGVESNRRRADGLSKRIWGEMGEGVGDLWKVKVLVKANAMGEMSGQR